MEQRKRPSNIESSSISEKLDKLANDMKKLPDKRKELLEGLMKKRLYTSKEACEILGVSAPSLRRAIQQEKIKSVHVGRFLRIPVEEIERLTQGKESLSVKEAAELLNVGPKAVRSLINGGAIQAFRLADAGAFRIPLEEIEKFMRGDKPTENDKE